MASQDNDKRKIREYEKIHQSRVQQATRKGRIYTYLSKLVSKTIDARRKGKGFLNKKDGYFDFHEGHAAGWGFLLMDLYFRLENGIFLVLFITGIGIAWKNPTSKQHSAVSKYFKSEIMNNIHYYVLFGVLAAFLWTQLSGASPPPVDQGLIVSVLGALFGL